MSRLEAFPRAPFQSWCFTSSPRARTDRGKWAWGEGASEQASKRGICPRQSTTSTSSSLSVAPAFSAASGSRREMNPLSRRVRSKPFSNVFSRAAQITSVGVAVRDSRLPRPRRPAALARSSFCLPSVCQWVSLRRNPSSGHPLEGRYFGDMGQGGTVREGGGELDMTR